MLHMTEPHRGIRNNTHLFHVKREERTSLQQCTKLFGHTVNGVAGKI